MATVAEVAVNRPALPLRIRRAPRWKEASASASTGEPGGAATPDANALGLTFSYAIPEDLRDRVALGQLVEVPFRTGTLQGIVVGLSDEVPADVVLRPLTSILEATPVVDAARLRLARWLSERYLAPLQACLQLFLPPGSQRLPQTVAEAVPDKDLPPDLDAGAVALYHYLRRRGPVAVSELDAEALKLLTDIQLVRIYQRLAAPRARPAADRSVELIASPDQLEVALFKLGHPSKQADVLLYLASLDDPLPCVDDVCKATGCSKATLQTLSERGWVRLVPRRALVELSLRGTDLNAALAELERAPQQRAILERLRQCPGPLARADLGEASTYVSALAKKGYLRCWSEPASVCLAIEPDQVLEIALQLRGATRHAAVLDLLAREEGPVWVGWVYLQTDANAQTLAELQNAGLVAVAETRRWRDPLAGRTFVLETPPQLTAEQSAVWETISPALTSSSAAAPVFLLHGVTGSGKTEIYLRAVAEVLRRGKGAIFLVPEISLAAQTIHRVAARFPGQVAVWHSDLSLGERFDTWQRVRSGQLRVVVGARSALFAPVPNLGLIVVDEEHEPAYKQERLPRYHAREVALQLAHLTGAPVILGSATPDVTTFYRAERGEFQLLHLPSRVLAHRQYLASHKVATPRDATPVPGLTEVVSLPLPPVQVVDLRAELKAGNVSIFSRALQAAVRQTLAAGQQVILFLNRRGMATFVMCRDCGHVMSCPRCRLPLTFHAADEALTCHHCSHRQPNPTLCPACKSQRIRYFGLGTERVEAAVREMFPNARPLRWDQDTTRVRGSHAAYLEQFVEGRANVLIGTQLIAKGLDLPRVTLVGVISADTALFLPDFRAAERTFQLLTQVAGRAGRSPLGGRVIIQTYRPDLPVIQAAALHDYATFYRAELAARREGHYPPFKRLARLVFSGAGRARAQEQAEALATTLRREVAQRGYPSVEIVGPAPCFHPVLEGQYRWHIIVRADRPEVVLRNLPLPLGWRVDIDPVEFT